MGVGEIIFYLIFIVGGFLFGGLYLYVFIKNKLELRAQKKQAQKKNIAILEKSEPESIVDENENDVVDEDVEEAEAPDLASPELEFGIAGAKALEEAGRRLEERNIVCDQDGNSSSAGLDTASVYDLPGDNGNPENR